MKTDKPHSFDIRKKVYMIIAINVTLILIISVVYMLSIYQNRVRLIEMDRHSSLVLSVEEGIETLDGQLHNYLASKSSTDLNNTMIAIDSLEQIGRDASELSYSRADLLTRDLMGMKGHINAMADELIQLKRADNQPGIEEQLKTYDFLKSQSQNYVDEIKSLLLEENRISNIRYSDVIARVQLLSYIIIGLTVLVLMLLGDGMIKSIIKPMDKLSESAEEIAKGNFQVADVHIETNDELQLFSETFNQMKNSINEHIIDLQLQAETERLIKEKEIENLKIRNMLDTARLDALQSQINPHFLYNTLNAGVQLAMIEGGDRTSVFLEHMSSLFRYNLRGLEVATTIGDELANIDDYFELLKVRYGELIRFEFMVDEAIKDFLMPPLTLQPLVENAIIHGFSTKNTGGTVKIIGYEEEGSIVVAVWDSGKGMTEDEIEGQLSDSIAAEGERTSVGFRNVRKRLDLYFGGSSDVSIDSELNHFTRITLRFPKKEAV